MMSSASQQLWHDIHLVASSSASSVVVAASLLLCWEWRSANQRKDTQVQGRWGRRRRRSASSSHSLSAVQQILDTLFCAALNSLQLIRYDNEISASVAFHFFFPVASFQLTHSGLLCGEMDRQAVRQAEEVVNNCVGGSFCIKTWTIVLQRLTPNIYFPTTTCRPLIDMSFDMSPSNIPSLGDG